MIRVGTIEEGGVGGDSEKEVLIKGVSFVLDVVKVGICHSFGT